MRSQAVYKPEALRTRALLVGEEVKTPLEGFNSEREGFGELGRAPLARGLSGEEFVQGLLVGEGGLALHALSFVQRRAGVHLLLALCTLATSLR